MLSGVLTPSPGHAASPFPAAPPGVRLAVLSPRHSGRWFPLCPPTRNPFLLLPKAGSAPPAGNPAPPPSLPPDRELGTVPAAQSDCQSAPRVPPQSSLGPAPRQPVGIRASGISACAQVKRRGGAKGLVRGREVKFHAPVSRLGIPRALGSSPDRKMGCE